MFHDLRVTVPYPVLVKLLKQLLLAAVGEDPQLNELTNTISLIVFICMCKAKRKMVCSAQKLSETLTFLLIYLLNDHQSIPCMEGSFYLQIEKATAQGCLKPHGH